jgi:hypothetical protein
MAPQRLDHTAEVMTGGPLGGLRITPADGVDGGRVRIDR